MGFNPLTPLGKIAEKVSNAIKSIESNTAEIKRSQERSEKIVTELLKVRDRVTDLEKELEVERARNKELEKNYQLQIENMEMRLVNQLQKYEIELQKAINGLHQNRVTSDSNSALPPSVNPEDTTQDK